MFEEMRAFHKNETWEVVDFHSRRKPVECKLVLAIKYKDNGSSKRYKTRLVAKGYTQTLDIDY